MTDESGYYENAVVCERGHPLTSTLSAGQSFDQNFCDQCGAVAVSVCASCEHPIRGRYVRPGFTLGTYGYVPPVYCYNCGSAMAWTQRALDALAEIAAQDSDLSVDEQRQLIESAQRLADEEPSPETELAVSRFRRLAGKAGGQASAAIINIGTQVASAAVKHRLGI